VQHLLTATPQLGKKHNKVHAPQSNSSSFEKFSLLPLLPRRRRTPLVQSGQPLHFSHKHFFDQSLEFEAHHDLQSPGVGLGVGAGVGVGVGAGVGAGVAA